MDLGVGQAPDAGGMVVRRGRQPRAVRAKRNGHHMVGVAAEHSQLLSLHNIPQPHGVVSRTRRQPSPIGTEREPIDTVGVPLQRFYIPPADRIPEADRAAVVGGCQPLAIRAEIDGVHHAAIPCHYGDLLTRDGIPQSGRIALRLPDAIGCGGQASAVGAEGDPGDAGGVALQDGDRSTRIRAVLSDEPVTHRLPSGLNATEVMPAVCP